MIQDIKSTWPVFLIGCHRSGTTLLRYLLDSHPNLACPPESKFIAGVRALFDYPQAQTALESIGFSVDDIYGELRNLVDAFLGGYARKQGKPRWVDKTPNYYRHLDFLDDLFSREVLYVFIARHPLDCVESLNRYFYYAYSRDEPEAKRAAEQYGTGPYGWAKYWIEVNERLYLFSMSNPGRCHWIQYEKLVEDPRAAMTNLLAFLGESLPEDLIETAFQKEHTAGYEDHEIRATRTIHADSVGKWKSWTAAEIAALWRLVSDTAIQLGYDTPAQIRGAASGS